MFKKFLRVFPIVLVLISCHHAEKKKINASLIEVSVFGEAGGKTISIDSNGVVRKCFYRPGTSDCFMDTIDNDNIDSINIWLSKIKDTSIDSASTDNCIGCSNYIIRLDAGGESVTTLITGNSRNSEIGKFARFITGLRVYDGKKVDSVFSFSTGMRFPINSPTDF